MLTACGSSATKASGTTAKSAAKQVNLTFADFSQPAGFSEVSKLVSEWNATHPTIHVTVEHIAVSALPAKYAEELRAGQGPDVMHVAFVWTQELAKAGLLYPLTKLDASSPISDLKSFTALKINTYDGKLYALPWNVDTGALTYDPSVLKKVGIHTLPQTWSQLASVSAMISEKLPGTSGFCFPAGSKPNSDYFYFFNSYMWSNGQYLVKKSGSGYVAGVTASQLMNDFQYFKGLFSSGATPKSMISINQWGNPTYIHALASGTCAFGQEYPEDFPSVNSAANGALKTFAAPKGTVTRAWQLGGRSLAISARTKYPRQAWEFVKYLASASSMKAMGYYSPDPKLVTVSDPAESGFNEMIRYSHTFESYTASPINLPAVEAAIDTAGGAVDSGQIGAAAAATRVLATIEGYLKG